MHKRVSCSELRGDNFGRCFRPVWVIAPSINLNIGHRRNVGHMHRDIPGAAGCYLTGFVFYKSFSSGGLEIWHDLTEFWPKDLTFSGDKHLERNLRKVCPRSEKVDPVEMLVLLFNLSLVHRAILNRSDKNRIALAFHVAINGGDIREDDMSHFRSALGERTG